MMSEKAPMNDLIICDDALIQAVIGAAIEVHRELGPGLLELVYEQALMMEFGDRSIGAQAQVEVTTYYKRRKMALGVRADIIVENSLILEIKACSDLDPSDLAQILHYQKLLGFKRGLVINFNSEVLKDGIERISI